MKIIAYDLGTGGVKASLYDEEISTLWRNHSSVIRPSIPALICTSNDRKTWWNGVL